MGRKFELGFFDSNGWKKGDHCLGKAIVEESQNFRCSLSFKISKRIRREKEKGLRYKKREIEKFYTFNFMNWCEREYQVVGRVGSRLRLAANRSKKFRNRTFLASNFDSDWLMNPWVVWVSDKRKKNKRY